MALARLLVAVLVVCAHVISDVTSEGDVTGCPEPCTCYEDEHLVGTIHEENDDMLVIDCSNLGLSALPDLSTIKTEKIHKYLLNMNQLTDIPDNAFAGHSIHYLTLSDNPINIIGDLAFAGQERLEFLSLSRTRIQKLPKLDYLAQLRTLDLNAIPITELSETDLHGLEALEELVLSNILLTQIHEEALSSLHTLEILRLEGCDLTVIPEAVQKVPNLINLHMDFNQLSTLSADYHSMSALRTLTLSGNLLNDASLTETSFLGMPHLHKLDLSFNMVNQVPVEALPHLASLTVLRMPDNGITTIPDGAFHSQKSLRELSLAGNQITLTPENVMGLEDSLEVLNLARTNLNADTLPLAALQKLTQLKSLDLSGNQIVRTHDDMFGDLPNLEEISLMRAGLVDIAEYTFRGLGKPLLVLDLNQNSLQNISFIHDVKFFDKIELVGNPIHCACADLGLKYDAPVVLVGTCGTPEDVAGMDIAVFLSGSNCDPVMLPPAPVVTETVETPQVEEDRVEDDSVRPAVQNASAIVDVDMVAEEAILDAKNATVAGAVNTDVMAADAALASGNETGDVASESEADEGVYTTARDDEVLEPETDLLVSENRVDEEALNPETGVVASETETDPPADEVVSQAASDGADSETDGMVGAADPVITEVIRTDLALDDTATEADDVKTSDEVVGAADPVITEVIETDLTHDDTVTEADDVKTVGEEMEVISPMVNSETGEAESDDVVSESSVDEVALNPETGVVASETETEPPADEVVSQAASDDAERETDGAVGAADPDITEVIETDLSHDDAVTEADDVKTVGEEMEVISPMVGSEAESDDVVSESSVDEVALNPESGVVAPETETESPADEVVSQTASDGADSETDEVVGAADPVITEVIETDLALDDTATEADVVKTSDEVVGAADPVITEVIETDLTHDDSVTEADDVKTGDDDMEVISPMVNITATKEKEVDDEEEEEAVIKNEDESAEEMGLGLQLTANSQLLQGESDQTAPQTETHADEPPVLAAEPDVKAAVTEDNNQEEEEGKKKKVPTATLR